MRIFPIFIEFILLNFEVHFYLFAYIYLYILYKFIYLFINLLLHLHIYFTLFNLHLIVLKEKNAKQFALNNFEFENAKEFKFSTFVIEFKVRRTF